MESGNASYHQLYAEHLESAVLDPVHAGTGDGDPAPQSPRQRLLIDLGVLAEVHSGISLAAERYYLKAASVNRMFGPRWTLMNYYFRRHNPAAFWQWTREAMPMAYGDLTHIFRLCWLVTDDAESIRRQLPWTDYTRAQYLNFLLNDEHLQALAPPVAREVADRSTPEDLNLLLDYCGRAMTKNMESAVEVWNMLARRKLVPFDPLAPREGAIVTNGEFLKPPIERGFDWHLSRADGVSVTMDGASGVNVELTGDQAQAVTTINQWMPVEENQSYRIDYTYSGGGNVRRARSAAASGVRMGEIENPVSGAVLDAICRFDADHDRCLRSRGFHGHGKQRGHVVAQLRTRSRHRTARGEIHDQESFGTAAAMKTFAAGSLWLIIVVSIVTMWIPGALGRQYS